MSRRAWPRGRRGVRPTSGRVRDAMMNSLAPHLAGSRVLDLFAGTGGLGLGMLARGARSVVFVERDQHLVEVIRRDLAKEGWADRAEVWRKDALAAVRELGRRGERFDLILMDPPYGEGWIPKTLRAIRDAKIVALDGLIVAEGHWRDQAPLEAGFVQVREARYGETVLWSYTEDGGEPA
ncbi:MAG TPA: RsmD family RNA methyltransferase [bacterium]|nr:RsmD family RNA methyltransferase [bacterium]